MTFNDDARINSSKIGRRGKAGAAVGGVGVIGAIAFFVIQALTGVDLSGLAPTGQQGPSGPDAPLAECENISGEEAQKTVDCRLAGAAQSLSAFWSKELPKLGGTYNDPETLLFTDSVGTGCGNATSATGPFYCPPDQSIYIDTAFYDQLTSRLGANEGSLAEMYVLAHEYGHHIQNIGGIMEGLDTRTTGPDSDGVRLELQADCFAGAWVAAAASTKDDSGVALFEEPTQQEINDALSAASAVGDDRIQEKTQGQVNPETWSHGSSEQRQKWFETGRAKGASACDTFSVSGSQL